MNDPLFAPRGIAVVGASPKPSNIGGRVLAGLRRHAFPGDLAAVNPGHTEVHGTGCVPSLRDLPFRPDLALVSVAAHRVVEVVEEAAAAGVGAAVVYSSGFAETGDDGRREQQRLRRVARKRGVRVLGPNCQGLVDLRRGLAATFAPAVLDADPSTAVSVAYVGQSGAVGGVFFDLARARGVTPAAWVSTGNEADLTVAGAARRLVETDPVDLLCLYLEQVPDGGEWSALTRAARSAGTRVAVLRSGRSDSGRRAAASHTGALVGDDEPFRLACARDGIPEVDDVSDLVELAAHVRPRVSRSVSASPAIGVGESRNPVGGDRDPLGESRDPVGGDRGLGVVTTSGGAGGLAADLAEGRRLAVPVLGAATQRRLRAVLPAFGSATNPVDVTADLMVRRPEDLAAVCRIVAGDPGVDRVLLVVTNLVGPMADRVAASLVAEATDGPPDGLTVAYLAAPDRIVEPVRVLGEGGIPVHPTIRAAVGAIAALSAPGAAGTTTGSRDSPIRIAGLADTDRETRGVAGVPDLLPGPVLTEHAGTPLLDHAGVPRPEAVLVTDPGRLRDSVESLGGRAVLKLQSPDVPHKSELGLVRVGVGPDEAGAVGAAMLEAVPGARVEGILAQAPAPPGTELLVGVRAGRNGFPPTVTVGIGGVAVELYGDVATAFAPLDAAGAEALLRRLRGFPLLDGFRGRPRSDLAAAADAVARLSRLADLPGLVELEVNPLIVHAAGRGATAVDLLVRREGS